MTVDLDDLFGLLEPAALELKLGGKTYPVRPLRIADVRRLEKFNEFKDGENRDWLTGLFVGGHPPVLDQIGVEDEDERVVVNAQVMIILSAISKYALEEGVGKKLGAAIAKLNADPANDLATTSGET